MADLHHVDVRTTAKRRDRRAARRWAVPAAVALAALAISAVPALDAGAQPIARKDPGRASAGGLLEAGILDRINAVRRERGLRPLRAATGLVRAASSYVRTLATEGVFTHGSSPSARIRKFYAGSPVAEVMQWRTPALTPEQAVATWLGSPPHRSIILSARYSEIGLAVRAVASAPGYYGGRPVTIVVADLGAPRG